MSHGGLAVLDETPLRVAGQPVQAIRRDSALTGLAGSSLQDRFRSWRGRSGRRYIFSVFPEAVLDCSTSGPEFADAVVIAAACNPDGTRRIVRLALTNRCPDLFFRGAALAEARAEGATELHVHLLASSTAERRAIAADLRQGG